MSQLLKQIVKKTPLYYPLRNWVVYPWRNWVVVVRKWGKPVPPAHIVKQRTLQSYSKRFGLKILVETGTYYGDMVEAMKDSFDRIYSIELSRELYGKARERFKGATRIELICGDSGVELRNVVSKLDQPALFWLDGHYSGGDTAKGDKDTPIYEELNQILDAPDLGHVIIIDDARCFGSDPAYPRIRELKHFIQSKRSNVDIVVQDDSIRITPKQ